MDVNSLARVTHKGHKHSFPTNNDSTVSRQEMYWFRWLDDFRDQYSDILTRQWVDIFNEIFNEDNYTPIYVESVEEYTAIVTQFPFQDEELEQASLPRNEVINLVINFGIKIINIGIWALKVKIKYQNARKFKEPQVDVC